MKIFQQISEFLQERQQNFMRQIESFIKKDQAFVSHKWQRDGSDGRLAGNGLTAYIDGDSIIEKCAINFSQIHGKKLPKEALANNPELADLPYQATGISIIFHPHNPHVPTSHANVRAFVVEGKEEPVWWTGGGFDLTPYYPVFNDVYFWHEQAKKVCDKYQEGLYFKLKKQCDDYFFLPHRQETRGVGGIFYENFKLEDSAQTFSFMQDVINCYFTSYLTILQNRSTEKYSEREKTFQNYRRGRYVEFNLLYDRGTMFGLKSKGNTEAILLSLPPTVHFTPFYTAEKDSPEADLQSFLTPRDWLKEKK